MFKLSTLPNFAKNFCAPPIGSNGVKSVSSYEAVALFRSYFSTIGSEKRETDDRFSKHRIGPKVTLHDSDEAKITIAGRDIKIFIGTVEGKQRSENVRNEITSEQSDLNSGPVGEAEVLRSRKAVIGIANRDVTETQIIDK